MSVFSQSFLVPFGRITASIHSAKTNAQTDGVWVIPMSGFLGAPTGFSIHVL